MTTEELKALGYGKARCPDCNRILRMHQLFPEYCLVKAKSMDGKYCLRYPAAVYAILRGE